MSVETTTNRIAYTGNGVQTVFPYDFKIFADADLQVYVDGTLKTLTTHYTVTGEGDDAGGDVTFGTAPANATAIVIIRVLEINQTVSYPSNSKFPAAVHEGALDRQAMISQQLAEVDARCLKLGITSDETEPTMDDPASVGHFLRVKTLSPLELEFAAVTGQGAIGFPIALADGGSGASYASAAALRAGLDVAAWKKGADIAAAATITVPNPLDGNYIVITGNTGVSAISTTGVDAGTILALEFTGTPVLTHGANFVLQGAVNYTVQANDVFLFQFMGSSKWREIHRSVGGGTTSKFWRGDGTWQSPSAYPVRDNLVITRASASTLTVTADGVTMTDSNGGGRTKRTLSATLDITVTSGINGLDTGAEANDTWYAVWAVSNGTTDGTLFSTSFTAPSTSRYAWTHALLVGAWYNAGADLKAGTQIGNATLWDDSVNVASPNLVANTTTSVTLATAVPPSRVKAAFGKWNAALGSHGGFHWDAVTFPNTVAMNTADAAFTVKPENNSVTGAVWHLPVLKEAQTMYVQSITAGVHNMYCSGFELNF